MSLPILHLWQDNTPRLGPVNMGLDEAMLSAAGDPWLRIYGWQEPSLSIGFSQALTMVPPEKAGWPLVRRWTGGGVVVHDGDWTYTLAVPTHVPLSGQKAVETYRWIHECMIDAMTEVGIEGGELQPEHTSDGMGVCFVEPAKFDVVWQGQKIAGAAQRRSKVGLLHQGTIQSLQLPERFGMAFAQKLGHEIRVVSQEEAEAALLPRALELAEHKYGTSSWRDHRTASPIPVTA